MSQSTLAAIAEIQGLDLAGLRERWRVLYGSDPPRYSREHLTRRLCHRVQELQLGCISDATRSTLRAIAELDAPGGQARRLNRRNSNSDAHVAGTKFVRIWRDQRHEVTALADGGFEYAGCRYKSLSAVAKKITNAHWSGALSFGLRTRRKERG